MLCLCPVTTAQSLEQRGVRAVEHILETTEPGQIRSMPRTLPWLTDTPAKRQISTPQKPQEYAFSPTSNAIDSDVDAVPGQSHPKHWSTKTSHRAASSSPVSGSPAVRPEISFMKEGFAADDIYMMVEDEFDHTARLFTQHIHAAEYERLKRLHKSRGADTLANLERATDEKTVQGKELRIALEQQERMRKRGASKATDEESKAEEEHDAYMQDPQLFGLMAGIEELRPSRELGGFSKAKSHARVTTERSRSPYRNKKCIHTSISEGPRAEHGPASVFYNVGDDENDADADDDLGVTFYTIERSSTIPQIGHGSSTEQIRLSSRHESTEKPKRPDGFTHPFAESRRGKELVRDKTSQRTDPIAHTPVIKTSGLQRSPPTTTAPNQSPGGVGSRIARRLVQRNLKPETQSEVSLSQQAKRERMLLANSGSSLPKVRGPSSANNTFLGCNTDPISLQRKRLKHEEDAKKRRRFDDIPTFLL